MAKKRPQQPREQSPAAPAEQSPNEPSLPPEEIRHADGRIEHPRARRETRDVGFWPVLAFVTASILVGAVQLFLVWQLFRQGEEHAEQLDATRHPLATRSELPQPPRLEQIDRSQGLEAGNVRRPETRDLDKLNRFGVTDDEGYIHIPIQDAMQLVVDTLPVRPSNAADDYRSRGLVDGGESNSGRMFRRQP